MRSWTPADTLTKARHAGRQVQNVPPVLRTAASSQLSASLQALQWVGSRRGASLPVPAAPRNRAMLVHALHAWQSCSATRRPQNGLLIVAGRCWPAPRPFLSVTMHTHDLARAARKCCCELLLWDRIVSHPCSQELVQLAFLFVSSVSSIHDCPTGADAWRPECDYFDYFYADVDATALNDDAQASSHPLSLPAPIQRLGDIDNLFDRIEYEKACLALN